MATRQRRRRGLWPWLPVLVAAAAIVMGLRSGVPGRDKQQPRGHDVEITSASLRLMSLYGPAFAGEMLFAGAGTGSQTLQLQVRAGGSAAEPIASVLAGVDTFGVTRSDTFLLARGSGAPIVGFAAGYVESPVAFYVLKQSGLRTPADFVGHRVGRRGVDDTTIAYSALAARLGLERSRITEVPVDTDLSMLLRGEVDVWPGHVGEEDYALEEQGADPILISPASYGVHLPGTVYFTTERTVKEQPRMVQQFLNGVIAGWESAYADYTKSIPMIAAFNSKRLTPGYLRFVLERQREYLRPLALRFGEFDDSQWRSLQEALLALRLLAQPVDLSKAVTYDFLREAYRKPLSFGSR